MIRFFLLVFVLCALAVAGQDPQAEELDEAQIQAEMDQAVVDLEAAILRLQSAQEKVDQGLTARWALAPLVEGLDRARLAVDQAEMKRSRLEWARAAAKAEQEALEESVRRSTQVQYTGLSERFGGSSDFHLARMTDIEVQFQKNFNKPLPVSAKGQTRLHYSLGFNHSGRADIAVSPDSEEGRWLRDYLQNQGIPYLAFRSKIQGASTAPHIHIGLPSVRLAP